MNRPELTSSLPLSGERLAFTGTLASMSHEQAHRLVAEQGGESTEHVSRQTTMLVVGEEGWPLEDDGQPSLKLQQAHRWIADGYDIRITPESDWLRLVGLDESRENVHRLYTPAMLSGLLNVPVRIIRRWERLGLIVPVRKVHRLPYFDFREVTLVRRLVELLDEGVPTRVLETALTQLPGAEQAGSRAVEKLELLVRDEELVVRDRHGLISPRHRQRLFDFTPRSEDEHPSPGDNDGEPPAEQMLVRYETPPEAAVEPDRDWFIEGCRRYEQDDLSAAVEAFRYCLMREPENPEAHFQLGECLYRQQNLGGAVERYFCATEHDPEYLEAWVQLGCIHSELGNPAAALELLEIALTIHPDYPDAHFHKGDVLVELGRTEEAQSHYRQYLEFEQRGPWADLARQRCDTPGDLSLRSE